MPNELKSYKRLIKTVSDARNAGLIDWDSIEDRTRELVTHNSWDSPEEIIGDVASQYREDIWADQIWRPEVWIEKAALLGVVAPICDEFRVPYFAHIGNNSQSEQYKAGKRFAGLFDQGRIPLVLHLADHDPNGIDMTRDNTERLGALCQARGRGASHRAEHRPGADRTTRHRTSPRKPTPGLPPMSRSSARSAGNWMRCRRP